MGNFIENAEKLFYDISYLFFVLRKSRVLIKDQRQAKRELTLGQEYKPTQTQADIINRNDPISKGLKNNLEILQTTGILPDSPYIPHPSKSGVVLYNRLDLTNKTGIEFVQQSRKEAIDAVKQSIKALLGLK